MAEHRGKIPTEREKITKRLSTFKDWPGFVQPYQLAVAGFRYTGDVDKVSCEFCNVNFYNWRTGFKPLDIHRKYSPACSFVTKWFSNGTEAQRNKNNTRNQNFPGVKSSNYEASKAKHPEFVEFSKRLKSFQGWPHQRLIQSPQNMAIAGFYYVGPSDRCRCFYCGIILRDWDKDDCPTICHQQWSPACSYINYIVERNRTPKVKVIDLAGFDARSNPPSTINRTVSHGTNNTEGPNTRTSISNSSTLSYPSPSPYSDSHSSVRTRSVLSSTTNHSAIPSPTERNHRQIGYGVNSGSISAGPQATSVVSTASTSVLRHTPAVEALLDWGYDLETVQEGIRKHTETTGKSSFGAKDLFKVLEGNA